MCTYRHVRHPKCAPVQTVVHFVVQNFTETFR